MKRMISAVLCAAMLAMPAAQAAELQPATLNKGVLGTLGSSGVSYEARLTVPGYLGQLETTLVIDGEEEDVSVSVVARDTQESASHRVAGLSVAKGLWSVKFVYEVFEDGLVAK